MRTYILTNTLFKPGRNISYITRLRLKNMKLFDMFAPWEYVVGGGH